MYQYLIDRGQLEFMCQELSIINSHYQNLEALVRVAMVLMRECVFCGYPGDSEDILVEYPGMVGYWHTQCYNDMALAMQHHQDERILSQVASEAECAWQIMVEEDEEFVAQTPDGGEL